MNSTLAKTKAVVSYSTIIEPKPFVQKKRKDIISLIIKKIKLHDIIWMVVLFAMNRMYKNVIIYT